MALKTTTLANGTVALLEPKGSLVGGEETDELRGAVADLVEQGNKKLVIDLSKVTYLNEVEAAKVGEVNDRNVERPWEIWKNQALCRMQKR